MNSDTGTRLWGHGFAPSIRVPQLSDGRGRHWSVPQTKCRIQLMTTTNSSFWRLINAAKTMFWWLPGVVFENANYGSWMCDGQPALKRGSGFGAANA